MARTKKNPGRPKSTPRPKEVVDVPEPAPQDTPIIDVPGLAPTDTPVAEIPGPDPPATFTPSTSTTHRFTTTDKSKLKDPPGYSTPHGIPTMAGVGYFNVTPSYEASTLTDDKEHENQKPSYDDELQKLKEIVSDVYEETIKTYFPNRSLTRSQLKNLVRSPYKKSYKRR